MGTRRRTYNCLPPATHEWELHLTRSLGDSTSRGYRDLHEFVSRLIERSTIRPRRSRSPPPHRSRSAVGRSTHGRTPSSNRRRTSRSPPRGRPGGRRSHRGILWNSSPLRSPVRSLTPTPPRVVREVTPGTRRATGRKSPGTAARTSPTKEKQATPREKVSPEKEKSARRLTPEKQLNQTRKFPVTSTSTGSGAGPSGSQVHQKSTPQKSTPKAITRPSAKDLRESIKANREECKRLAKQLQDSVDRREKALADKSEKPRKKFPVSKATVSSSSSSSGTSRASSAESVQPEMSPAASTLTVPLTPDFQPRTGKAQKRTERVSRDASDNLD